jgi:hypothetical protein
MPVVSFPIVWAGQNAGNGISRHTLFCRQGDRSFSEWQDGAKNKGKK